jgi:quercetin dioxygenase-like cupin family protein
MTGRARTVVGALALAATVTLNSSLAFGQADTRGFVRVTPQQVKWVDDPPENFGIKRATIQGDPSKPGIYVIRIRFPRGVMGLPHYHKEDRHAVVLQGTWYTGTGADFQPDKTVGLKPGSYMLHPAGERHFDGAKEEDVVLQITGYGPSETIRLGKENYVRMMK